MRLSEEQIHKIVKRRLSVTHQNVAIMKGLLVKHFQPNTQSMIHAALGSLSIQRPERLLLRAEEDSTAQVERLEVITSHNAFVPSKLSGI